MAMKKRIIFFTLTVLLAISMLCGCSLLSPNSSPKIVYKSYIDVTDAASAQSGLFTECAGSVVTVISEFRFNDSARHYRYLSGVIIDREGYLLTASEAAYDDKFLEANAVYAVLSDIYDDTTRYELKLVDYDRDLDLAIFRFVDEFHYYTNAQKTASADGFQFFASFSGIAPKTGEVCFAVGNNLGDYNSSSSLSSLYLQQAVMSGIISSASADTDVLEPAKFGEKEYSYLLTSASVSDEMIGGALFDQNGYLLGLLSYKLYDSSQSGTATEPLTRISLASPISLLCDYIDAVSAEYKTVIPYTLASISNKGGVA